MVKKGITILLNQDVAQIQKLADGSLSVRLVDAQTAPLLVDAVLYATGRVRLPRVWVWQKSGWR